jgi:hypothetical protein
MAPTMAASGLKSPLNGGYFQLSTLATNMRPFHTNLLVFSSPIDYKLTKLEIKVKFKVTLRLAVYRQSVCLGVKPIETHDQRFFSFQLNPCGISP